ncbi:MAG TPA: hypothetical protein VGG04_05960 [Candidatus Sulfotelmatobacter sp.]
MFLSRLLIAIVLGGTALSSVSAERRITAVLENIDEDCQAALSEPGKRAAIDLDRFRDGYRYLSAGETVRCKGRGFLTVYVPSNPKDKRELKVGREGYTAPTDSENVSRAVRAQQEQLERQTSAALQARSSPAGTRAAVGRVLDPTPDSVVWPKHFVIRWRRFAAPVRLSLSIHRDDSPQLAWQADDVDGQAGQLDSAEARAALLNCRRSTCRNLSLHWQSVNSSYDIPFVLLSETDEETLERELQNWAQLTDPVLAHIGRAYSLQLRKLYAEAAQEYQQALKQAPQSCQLLHDARNVTDNTSDLDLLTEIDGAIEKAHCPAQ